MQERLLCSLVGELQAQSLSYGLSHTLQSEEGFLVAPQTDAQHILLIGILSQRQSLGNKDLGHLVQTTFHVAALHVAGDGMDHGSSQSSAHDGQTLVDGVDQRDGLSLRSILRKAQQIQISRGEEGVMYALVSAGGTQSSL